MWNCQQTLGSMKGSRSQVSTAKLKWGMEEQSAFHCSSESQWQPPSSVQEAGISDSGAQATQTHGNLLRQVCSRFFYLCTKVTVGVLRMAANCEKSKPVISPWNRFLLGLTGCLWINPHSQWGIARQGSKWPADSWLQEAVFQLIGIPVSQKRKCSDMIWHQRRVVSLLSYGRGPLPGLSLKRRLWGSWLEGGGGKKFCNLGSGWI